MTYYLVLYRSITRAQRAVSALERAGITVRLLRAPKRISPEGCGYGVKLPERSLSQALVRLNSAGLTPGSVYISSADGDWREVDK